jgi:hypothetical protein
MLFFKYLPGHYQGADHTGRRVLNFDSGGSSQPTATSTVSIPEYAQPYMEDVLGKAEALTTAPYQIYGGERFAGPSDLQAQARGEAGMLQAPGQFDVGTGLVGAGGISALGASFDPNVQQYQMAGPQTFGVEQATQYMSPFMQNVVDIQKRKAIEDAQKTQLGASLGSARTGSYGGARQLLAQTQREGALGSQLGDIQAKGLQSAFDQAQQQFERDRAAQLGVQQQNLQALLDTQKLSQAGRQFGAELGLKGAQTAIGAGEGLAKIGATEQAADLDRLKFQEAMGQLSQADQQRLYDLQYQDFVAQQQSPYQNIGFMSDILRGSANLAKNVGVYDAPANPLQQIVGPGLLGLGLYKEFNR